MEPPRSSRLFTAMIIEGARLALRAESTPSIRRRRSTVLRASLGLLAAGVVIAAGCGPSATISYNPNDASDVWYPDISNGDVVSWYDHISIDTGPPDTGSQQDASDEDVWFVDISAPNEAGGDGGE